MREGAARQRANSLAAGAASREAGEESKFEAAAVHTSLDPIQDAGVAARVASVLGASHLVVEIDELKDADIAYARAGESYDITEVGIFRYLRIKVLESWGGEQAVHFMELEFFGIPHEETGINDSNI